MKTSLLPHKITIRIKFFRGVTCSYDCLSHFDNNKDVSQPYISSKEEKAIKIRSSINNETFGKLGSQDYCFIGYWQQQLTNTDEGEYYKGNIKLNLTMSIIS